MISKITLPHFGLGLCGLPLFKSTWLCWGALPFPTRVKLALFLQSCGSQQEEVDLDSTNALPAVTSTNTMPTGSHLPLVRTLLLVKSWAWTS